ncbi:MAG: DUF6520 family protein [Bacteroidota bacterium]|nr:DUF6520 family protein [Bacteroidota bacterium]UBZ14479.1 DUF6520 family protein [Allomuricauda aquimarina]
MKSNFLKLVLPAFAMLLAVGLAFATEDSNIPQTGYYNHPLYGAQPVPGGVDCITNGTTRCTYGEYEVFADEGLSIKLYERL